jgi:tetratricopeptide (TPR) repeat protein
MVNTNIQPLKHSTNYIAFLLMVLFLAPTGCKNDSKPAPDALLKQQQDPQLVALNDLVSKNPNNDSLLYRRAKVFYKLQAYDEALADVGQAMKLDSTKPDYYHLMANVFMDYSRPHDSRRAIEVMQAAAKRFPGRIPTLLKLSEFQLIVKQHSEALSTLNQVLVKDPQNAEAFFMSARVALDQGDTTNAIKALRTSVQINADNFDCWMFLGKIMAVRKNPQAIQCFDNAIRVDSTRIEARDLKAEFYKRQGAFDKAFAVYRDIITRNPDYSNAYFDMGMIYLELDSFPKAYTNFDIAIKTDPLFVNAYYYRGVCSEMEDHPAAALGDYAQASKMAPDFQEAKEAKERLEKSLNKK